MPSLTFKTPRVFDLPILKHHLSQCDLPTEDVGEHLENFLLLEIDGQLAGSAGLEFYGTIALFRSLAVSSRFRGKGIGKKLLIEMIGRAHKKQVQDLYLLTTSAHDYFEKLGFRDVPQDLVPQAIRSTKSFSVLCPSSAMVMHRHLDSAAFS